MCELAKGTCGTCVWEIDIKGTLTIRPADGKNGKLDSFDCITLFPWHVHSRTVRKTVIEDGVKAERSICGIFRNMTLCREFDIGRLDISDTEDIGYVFQNCTNVESIPSIVRWDTGKVQEMEFMFYGCSSLRDISFAREWNTENVNSMEGVFVGCRALSDISPLAGWRTGKTEDMMRMFNKCAALSDISPLVNWDTKNVTDMCSMFSGCTALRNADAVRNWNVGSMEGCNGMFLDTGVAENPFDEKIPMACPRSGAFTGYKKCLDDEIVELLVPEDARRSSACGRKCRCDKAVVVRITDKDGNEVQEAKSWFKPAFIYKKGETVSVPDFSTERFCECSEGIHLFMTREEAEKY